MCLPLGKRLEGKTGGLTLTLHRSSVCVGQEGWAEESLMCRIGRLSESKDLQAFLPSLTTMPSPATISSLSFLPWDKFLERAVCTQYLHLPRVSLTPWWLQSGCWIPFFPGDGDLCIDWVIAPFSFLSYWTSLFFGLCWFLFSLCFLHSWPPCCHFLLVLLVLLLVSW